MEEKQIKLPAPVELQYYHVGEPVAWLRKTVTWSYDLEDTKHSAIKPEGDSDERDD